MPGSGTTPQITFFPDEKVVIELQATHTPSLPKRKSIHIKRRSYTRQKGGRVSVMFVQCGGGFCCGAWFYAEPGVGRYASRSAVGCWSLSVGPWRVSSQKYSCGAELSTTGGKFFCAFLCPLPTPTLLICLWGLLPREVGPGFCGFLGGTWTLLGGVQWGLGLL